MKGTLISGTYFRYLDNVHYKFDGLTINSTLSWSKHISGLTTKLNKACYAIRAIKPFMAPNVLRTVYFSYFHSVMSYGIIFWGNSHLSNNIFKI
jgi:hypothetical protein